MIHILFPQISTVQERLKPQHRPTQAGSTHKSFVPYSGEVGVSGSSITTYILFLVVLTKDLWKQGFILFVLWFEGHHSGEASCWGSVGVRP